MVNPPFFFLPSIKKKPRQGLVFAGLERPGVVVTGSHN
jgi:hypothetical protein